MKTIAEKARAAGIDPGVVYNRTHKGWTLEQALSTPARKQVKRLPSKAPDKLAMMIAAGAANGIPERVVKARLSAGWPAGKATKQPYSPRKKKIKSPAKAPVVATESDKSDGMVAAASLIAAVVAVLIFLYMQA